MPVGNASSPIKFSELQSFYGGSNPISLSEYYRGGSEVPTTVDTTQSVNATYSGGLKGAGAGGNGYKNNPNFESSALSITFPANTVVSAAVPWSWSTTNVVYSNPQKGSQPEDPYAWTVVTWSGSLTIGGQTYTNVSNQTQAQAGQSFFADNTGIAGVSGPNRFYWRVSAGSGLAITGYNVYDGPGSPGSLPTSNSQALLNDANSVSILYNLQPGAASSQPTGSGSSPVSGADNSASGSFTIAGTTGSSGCTIKMFLGNVISNSSRVGWSPQSLGTRSGTQTVQGDTNVGVPTSGTIDLNDFRTLTSPNAG